ncbi:MAG: DUF2071 domain-containing protein [Acidimicrobiia bacterium]|nr:DUF2071 domain-containing protein [Acidimicrobiia bacterium]
MTRSPLIEAASLPPLVVEPVARPVMTQHWADVVFLHWRYPPAAVQRLLPAGVEVDTHDGSAWVGLVPFSMERLGLPGLPPFPLFGAFPEVNVRTYVHSGPRRGVWFFSLDIDKVLPTAVARFAYRLPYCYGRAKHTRIGEIVSSRADRRWPRTAEVAKADIEIRTGAPLDAQDDLTRFLTSRWGLISASRRGRLRYAPVEHPPWPLYRGEVIRLDESLVTATGLPAPHSGPYVLWSPGVDVRVGRPKRIEPKQSEIP